MSIRKRESEKTKNGYVFEVFIKYVDYAGNKKEYLRADFLQKRKLKSMKLKKRKKSAKTSI